ncbi:MAG: 2-polyprenyl-6-methoxyphenol hydroxylase [Thiobacillus sp. SCN 64-317]|nr:FAD-dependent monooxygenase [Thiobacillus sp.]ODU91272.1 MAG: 2-polyprenyl-6-methoxyphenol hydroxylase [Thiobacillus sp. SCN 65-179]ODV10506.1 MAG: 2-polyprenyl-6-methoxyphenol hydroxylase [Thiobacillus sp. SCN 64-317]OJW38174.1 MAG: 2-polyprenyl-6-methoxyphenol hydroxylase [Thiobacillus sp. 65-69]
MAADAREVLIVGAGPAGAVCALALAQQGVPARVLEAQPFEARGDTRTLALSHGARLILERVGVWDALGAVTPITRIHISQRGALGVAHLDAAELAVPALGYVLPYAELTAALKQALAGAGVAVDYGVAVERIDNGTDVATLHTSSGVLTAPLAVVADGGRSLEAPAPRVRREYDQTAVVCDVRTELPHANRAYERFTPDGPAALLPNGDRYALVWTASTAEAGRIAALDDAAFLDALYRHFGGRQGRFLEAGPRKTFPLKLAYTGSEAGARVVRIGNAAQTLHPVAGQGFNIGLRDAFELALACADVPSDQLGNAAMLAAYARGRRADVAGGLGFTDFLVRTFSNDFPPLRHARGLGLLALEVLPPLKTFVARRMMFGARG